MRPERWKGGRCGAPFPVYEDAVGDLLAAHRSGDSPRDAAVAHVLATCAGYAYADLDTFATIASRIGFAEPACVCVSQAVDAMFIFSTAYLMQSSCGRVVILAYRGTQPANLANWLGDADIGSESMVLAGQPLAVHSGFHRNFRATRTAVLDELIAAREGRSLFDPEVKVDRPMEALYVTGHSLGGAMAVLFALSAAADPDFASIADRLRAVYTFAQPMAVGEPLPEIASRASRTLFRHVMARDIVPSLPPAGWGHFAHAGREFRYDEGEWREQQAPLTQLTNFLAIPRAFLATLARTSRRAESPFTLDDHGPHHYISALRPPGRVTEFGDRG